MRTAVNLTLSSLVILLLLAACTDPFSHGSGASQEAVLNAQNEKAVTYANAAPILQTYCVRCHAGYATYAGATSAMAGIYQKVSTHTMPPPGALLLPDDQAMILENWIESGAPQGSSSAPTPTPAPEMPVSPTWSSISANIINAKCIMCHKADSKHGSLANYNDLFSMGTFDTTDPLSGPKVVRNQPENSPLYEVLEDGAKVVMPPKRTGVTLSGAERDAIRQWILNGAENDLLPQ